MIHTIKNYKWVITTSLICIIFGLFTFFTFVNQDFVKVDDDRLQLLLLADLSILILFFIIIIYKVYKVLLEKRKGRLGSKTSLRYIFFFSTTTLIPSVLIAVFSLILFNIGLQKYFDSKIKTVVNTSAEVTQNYINEIRNSIEADIILVAIDINKQTKMYYENPKKFLNLISSQRLLRRLDEIYLLDSSGNIIMSNVIDTSRKYVPPPDEAYTLSLDGQPARIIDPETNKTSALVKLNNYIDTYLYIVKFMDPKLINYLIDTEKAVGFYYNVQEKKTGIKITFAVIYLLIVSLFLFLSIILSINFASRLTTPVINLIKASEKISSGDLNAKVIQIETDDEFKKLNLNFNSMIDKLKKQQDKLLFSERHAAWESVARKLAHEIKNPLTPIQLSIDRIREKYLNKIDDSDKNFSNYLNTITKQIHDIEYLLNEFSDFARMPKPILKKIDLNNIIIRTINLNELPESEIIFIFKKEKQSLNINGDEEQLNRVFINLIKNSIESIKDKKTKNLDFKGQISVDIKTDSDYIYVTITDNGVGFEQVDKTKMLTPYYTTKKKGTGLGLAIVTKVISDHNSTILFNSIDNGAEVKIILPKYYG
jgi:two-component system nitrogen regulation sensor histidine kinase NtrY